MSPRKLSAQFAAYHWYIEMAGLARAPRELTASAAREAVVLRKQASRFARQHWSSFLPVADPGWGRLLLKIAARQQTGALVGSGKAV